MQYNLWFNICAVAVLLELLALYYMKFNAPFKKYDLFLVLLWASMISSITSITNNLLPGFAPLWLIRSSHTIYFVAHGLLAPTLFLYVCSLTDYNLQDWRRLVPWLIPSAFGILMILTSWFSDSIFYLDTQGGYHRGPLLPLIYIITGYTFFLILYSLHRHRRVIPDRERLSIYLFLIMTTAAMVFQLVHPRLLVENFVCAACLMVSQMTVQNPEIVLDGPTGMLNKLGFSSLLAPKFDNNSRFQIGFLIVDNHHELEKIYGYERLESKLLVLADYMKKHPGYIFARLNNHIFCFISSTDGCCDSILRDLEGDRLFQHLRQEGVGVRFRMKTGILTCPDDAASYSRLLSMINEAAKQPRAKETDVYKLSTMDILSLCRRKKIDELVREAVSGNMLQLVYQPVYSIHEDRFISAEALLRMHSDSLGNISPAEFIQIAEENGAIVQMTQFVVDSVCHFISEIQKKGLTLKRIHINLSAIDCMQSDLPTRILESVRNHGINPSSLSIEITETAFATMPDTIQESLAALSKAGISVMLDDYGTGYSNLNRLLTLPLDVVKLDKSLVDSIIDSPDSRIILDSTIQMMKSLNKKILVEGVETKEQADYLKAHGCDYIQGYYYAKPMDGARLEKLLEQKK